MTQRNRKSSSKRKRSGPTARNSQALAVRSPKKSLRAELALLREVAVAAEGAIRVTPDASDRLVRFDLEILMRGSNSLKAMMVLLEQGYWEHAVAIVRQLFELLVNMEHLAQQEDREAGALLFARYGMLQMIQAHHRRLTYEKDTGRQVDEELFAQLGWWLENEFTDFRAKTKNDSVKWVSSWCRQTALDLAKASSDSMRVNQYNILYRVWSEEVHAAPGALISNMFRDVEDGWVERTVSENERRSREAAFLGVAFFLALWMQLPHVEKSVQRIQGWLQQMSRAYGGPDLPDPPSV
ncbi:DUF5677 domain-containing protein [Streptomyces sp. WG5]|uniref:DUF5677 domain-containing protein n=1 Tax=Streptomyces sp. WG5 TaxID=3417648 RepID=UPI003CF58B76